MPLPSHFLLLSRHGRHSWGEGDTEKERQSERKRREKWLCALTLLSPPPKAPFRLLAEQKHLLPYCAAQTPLNTHAYSSRVRSLAGAKKGSTGPYAAEAAHLVAQPIVRPIPGASPSIFVSRGQTEKEREREKLCMTEWEREGHKTAAAGWIGVGMKGWGGSERERRGQLQGGPTPPSLHL